MNLVSLNYFHQTKLNFVFQNMFAMSHVSTQPLHSKIFGN